MTKIASLHQRKGDIEKDIQAGKDPSEVLRQYDESGDGQQARKNIQRRFKNFLANLMSGGRELPGRMGMVKNLGEEELTALNQGIKVLTQLKAEVQQAIESRRMADEEARCKSWSCDKLWPAWSEAGVPWTTLGYPN